ncbi:MAG TPA: DNA-binding protein [Burkholderiaceae bacterium]|nr:DNA-binding protein [Burkholderiaceae bacterium]
MEVAHLDQKQLAARWRVSETSLERWRSEGIGPKFLKLCGRILYRQIDIEDYEELSLQISTSKSVTAAPQVEGLIKR